MNQDELKQQVGREAVKYIRPGMGQPFTAWWKHSVSMLRMVIYLILFVLQPQTELLAKLKVLGLRLKKLMMLIILTLLLMGLMKSVIISKESRVAVALSSGKRLSPTILTT